MIIIMNILHKKSIVIISVLCHIVQLKRTADIMQNAD